jgi:hypothetical protein
LGGSIHTIEKNTEALLVSSKEIGQEVNADRTKYMVMSQYQNTGQSHNVKLDKSSLEMVEEFKYLGTTLTNQNSNQEEIKTRLKSGNAFCHSVQNLSSSCLLSKNTKIKIYRSVILHVLYGCETWSLTLREERRLRVFEKRVLRKIFGRKRDEVTGERRKLHNEELKDLYSSSSIVLVIKSRKMRWAGHAARMGERGVVYRVLVGEPEGKKPLGRPKRSWEDTIKTDVQEVGCGGIDWIDLAEDRDRWWALVNAVMNLQVP